MASYSFGWWQAEWWGGLLQHIAGWLSAEVIKKARHLDHHPVNIPELCLHGGFDDRDDFFF
jgi:hypothetical protein